LGSASDSLAALVEQLQRAAPGRQKVLHWCSAGGALCGGACAEAQEGNGKLSAAWRQAAGSPKRHTCVGHTQAMRPSVMAAFSTRLRGICPSDAPRMGTSRSAIGAAKGASSSGRCLIASSPAVAQEKLSGMYPEGMRKRSHSATGAATGASSSGRCLIASSPGDAAKQQLGGEAGVRPSPPGNLPAISRVISRFELPRNKHESLKTDALQPAGALHGAADLERRQQRARH